MFNGFRRILVVLLVLTLFPVSVLSELNIEEFPLIFSNEYADIYFDKIDIDNDQMKVYCICENKTDTDLSFRLRRCLVNGWDIIESSTFDGFFRVSAKSKKRDCFEFDHGVSSSGISDPELITSIDFSLELKPWNGGHAIFEQEDYSHYDLKDDAP